MDSALALMNWLLPLFYLGLLLRYGAVFYRRRGGRRRDPWPGAVMAVHLLWFVLNGLRLGYPPLRGVHNVLSLVALITAAAYWFVELASAERRTGLFLFVFVFLFQYTASVLGAGVAGAAAADAQPASNWLRLHIVPALMSYAGFTISAVYAGLHLAARKNLKRQRFGVFYDAMPSLELLAQMTWYALLLGFICLTVTVVTGSVVFAVSTHAGPPGWSFRILAKVLAGTAAWCVYLVAVVGRFARGWSAARIARFSVPGFGVLLLMLGISTVLS